MKDAKKNGVKPSEEIQRLNSEVNELRKYRHKYEEIRSSKAYQLGSLIAEHSTSPLRLLVLPIKIWTNFAMPHFFPRKFYFSPGRKGRKQAIKPLIANNEASNSYEPRPSKAIAEKKVEELNILCIADEFTFSAIRKESNFVQAKPDEGYVEINGKDPDLFFVESAWKGHDDLWDRKISNPSIELKSILKACNSKGVPTVFWNKEDPVHFETFLNTACLFDYVFTTDLDKVPEYKEHLGHDRVYWLPFGFQPRLFNPITNGHRAEKIFFAGAYYQRYEERAKQIEDFCRELPKVVPLDIFDRNLGTDDIRYKFPGQFQKFIRGTLSIDEVAEISKSYKYALNLNSIKQSQTMFARRVFESLASGNIVVSNFSRGVSNLLGDLVITSDNGKNLAKKIKDLKDSGQESMLILLGLRKVFLKYTSKKQLERMLRRLNSQRTEREEELITVFSRVETSLDAKRAIINFRLQVWQNKQLVFMAKDSDASNIELSEAEGNSSVYFLKQSQINSWIAQNEGLGVCAFFESRNSYGSNFLTDLMIAFEFSEKQAVTKSLSYGIENEQLAIARDGDDYSTVSRIKLESTLLRMAQKKTGFSLEDLLSKSWDEPLEVEATSMDRYSFIRNCDRLLTITEEALQVLEPGPHIFTGLSEIDSGQSNKKVTFRGSNQSSSLTELRSESLLSLFQGSGSGKSEQHQEIFWRSRGVKIRKDGQSLIIQSTVKPDSHEYIYTRDSIELDSGIQLAMHQGERYLELNMISVGEFSIKGVIRWLDDTSTVISSVLFDANSNQSLRVPENSSSFLIGLRIQGQGSLTLNKISFFHKEMTQTNIIGSGKTLIISNAYPSYENLYRHAFIHSRNRYYKSQGVDVDIFRLDTNGGVSFSEFEGLPILRGNLDALRDVLSSGAYDSIGVHFLSSEIWSALAPHAESIPITVWSHGADMEPYWRRPELEPTKEIVEESDSRFKFWSKLFANFPSRMKIVFVSESYFRQVREDYGIQLATNQYEVIPNPIDTDLFRFTSKPEEQRKAILSIRPFANSMYANDLTVSAILDLSKKPFFDDLSFTIVGDGKLFKSTVSPIRKFTNVNLIQGFLTQDEIAHLHKSHGVFLVPTRHDTQGVSRDEAMSSGLVPVTNSIAATREFVPEGTGFLCEPENHQELSSAVEKLYWDPNLFKNMSMAATNEIHNKRSAQRLGNLEIELLRKITFNK